MSNKKLNGKIVSLGAALLLVFFFSVVSHATPGELDPTFGAGGTVITVLSGGLSAQKMVLQPDGKIVVQGYINENDKYSSFLARYYSDGTLDTSFGTNGTVTVPWVAPLFENFRPGLRVVPDGKILISGSVNNPATDTNDFAVFRFNADGSRDTSFGANGVASASIGSASEGETLLVQSDGKILVAGNLYHCDYDYCYSDGIGATRFNDNGTIDTSFGTSGRLIIGGPNESSSVADSAALPDGKLLLIGSTYDGSSTSLFLIRLNPNGTLDASFGASGIFHPELDQRDNSVRQFTLQSDGKIVFATFNNSNQNTVTSTIVRLNPEGSFDASFGTNGKVVIPAVEGLFGFAVQIQPNGQILAAGETSQTAKFASAIVRLNADGSRDTSFGANGFVTTVLGSYGSVVTDLALQPDGKLVAYGTVFNYSPGKAAIGLARYLLDSATPTPTPTPMPTPTPTPTSTPTPTPSSTPPQRPAVNGKIAFNRDEIFTVNPDGSDLKQLTFEGGGEPLWSPDGMKIAFVRASGTDNPKAQICVMDADGNNQTCLTPSGDISVSPAWSPDSTQIAFARSIVIGVFGAGAMRQPVYKRDIYAMNADGSNQRNLTNSDPDDWVSVPSWSPDGTKISFSRGGRSPNTVRVMNADGSNQRDILNGYSYPKAWSPDSSKLLVSPSGTKGIWVVNPDGNNLTKVHEPIPSTASFPNVFDQHPVWSPDGSKLAFYTLFCDHNLCLDDFGYSEVVVINADGSHSTTVGGGGFVDSPAWSPDGTKVIFDAYLTENPGLFVANADGSRVTNVANGANGFNPSWQPLAPTSCPNPIDCRDFFVRQQYLDFLGREPDPQGFQDWLNVLDSCSADSNCLYGAGGKRVTVSQSFFGSQEFNLKGGYVFRFYKASLARIPTYEEMVTAMAGVNGTTADEVNQKRAAFASNWVLRADFLNAFPRTLTATEFVDNISQTAGITLSNRSQLITDLSVNNTDAGRAVTLRSIVDSQEEQNHEFNPAFVFMQYVGYLRRDPDANGYQDWLTYLNTHPGDFNTMVWGFVDSAEYRKRFGP